MSEGSGSTFAIIHVIAETGDIRGFNIQQVARNVIEIVDEMSAEISRLQAELEGWEAKLEEWEREANDE